MGSFRRATDEPRHCVSGGEALIQIAVNYYGNALLADALGQINGLAVNPNDPLPEGAEILITARFPAMSRISQQTQTRAVVELDMLPRRAVLVEVTETAYPGAVKNQVPIEGKCLYVLRDGKPVVRIDAKQADLWQVESKLFPWDTVVVDRRVRLVRGESYDFFLSPIPLTDNALSLLGKQLPDCETVKHVEASEDQSITLRDCFHYAIDLCEQEYRPRLESWTAWKLREDNAARIFIASTLKVLIADGDKLGLKNELNAGEPDAYLKKYEEEELKLRRPAEKSAADIANLVDSPDARAIEMAAMELGSLPLGMAMVFWAIVLRDMRETVPGRALLARVADDPSRLPLKYVFVEEKPSNYEEYQEYRYMALAGRAIFEELAPAVAAILRQRTKKDPIDVLIRYFESLSAEKTKILKGPYKLAWKSYVQGRPLGEGLHRPRRALSRMADAAVQKGIPARALPRSIAASERLSHKLEHLFRGAIPTVRLALEIGSVACAIGELLHDSDEKGESESGKTYPIIGLIRASADFGALVVESFEILGQQAGRRVIGAGLGVIAGVCDMLEFIHKSGEAEKDYDYNRGVGYSLAAVGSDKELGSAGQEEAADADSDDAGASDALLHRSCRL
jgi:hypothetical protein